MKKKNKLIAVILIFLFFTVLSILTLMLHFSFIESLRFIIGSLFVLFMPGFVWSFVFIQKNLESFGYIDRIILSFGLSFVLSPLTVFVLSKLGILITFINSIVEISFLILIGLIILSIQKFVFKYKNG